MAISIDWSSWPYLITIPQSDLTLVSGTRYEITVNTLWQLLRDFSDSPEAIGAPVTYRRIPATASTPAITEINDPTYAAQFENGSYSVDIINGNTNFRDVEVKNTVSIGTNNTTGFIDPQFLEATVFQDGIAYKPESGNVGTDFPNGTREFPLQSIMDVHALSKARGLRNIYVMADADISGMTMDMSGDQHLWIGDNRNITLTLSSGGAMNVTNNGFENLTVAGHTGGNNSFLRCDILDTSSIGGHATSCEFSGETTIIGNTDLESCFSGETGTGHPDFIINSGFTLQVSDWHRGFGIHQVVDGSHTIEIYGGQFHAGAGATGGTLYLRGMPSKPADDQSVGATIIDETGITHIWDYIQSSTRTSGELINLLDLIYDALDLNAARPNVYNNATKKTTGTNFTLTAVDDGINTTVTRT